jgi:hypothetical protein
MMGAFNFVEVQTLNGQSPRFFRYRRTAIKAFLFITFDLPQR